MLVVNMATADVEQSWTALRSRVSQITNNCDVVTALHANARSNASMLLSTTVNASAPLDMDV